jgi:DNA polymerase-3 subunit epsilon
LCQKLTGLYITKSECFQYKIKECDGACTGKISPLVYNERVQSYIDKNSFENQNMVLIDRGRTINERSAILIENGIYKGYAFYDLNYQINNIEILRNIIIPMQNNRDTRNIIQGHIRRSKSLKIKKF